MQILAANWIRHSVAGSLINPFQFSLKYWRVCEVWPGAVKLRDFRNFQLRIDDPFFYSLTKAKGPFIPTNFSSRIIIEPFLNCAEMENVRGEINVALRIGFEFHTTWFYFISRVLCTRHFDTSGPWILSRQTVCNLIIGLIFLGFGFRLISFRRVSFGTRESWREKMNFNGCKRGNNDDGNWSLNRT